MDQTERSLVIVLSMHRSGSSLSTGILHALGMSLGPFDLLGANSGNPHGHFEANPILELSRAVQMLAYGFTEDVPGEPETLSRFLATHGAWDASAEIPEELVERGRSLVRRLVDSGNISGFKDPRTVLIWPFWRRVLEDFRGIRVAPVMLLRSPHEIAMSIFDRSDAFYGYRSALDVTAIHLGKLASIVETWPEPIPRVRFGGSHYRSDMAEAVRFCGLTWDPAACERLFDRSSVHQNPASIAHGAQRLYDSLCGGDDPSNLATSRENLATLEADAYGRETRYRDQIERSRNQLDHVLQQRSQVELSLRQVVHARDQAEERARLVEEQSRESILELRQSHEALSEQAQEGLRQSQEELRQSQEELRQSQEELRQSQEELRQARQQTEETGDVLIQANRSLLGTQAELKLACEQLETVRADVGHLRSRLDRYEVHPLIGPALRSRRRLVRVIDSLRSRAAV